jgi:hypothetical protein
LEDRRLLAVVTVNTLSDTTDLNDGLTTLREAIFATNIVPGADTIEFAPSLTAGGSASIVLTQGELKITDSLTIHGPGSALLTIDASGSDPTPTTNNRDGSRIFNVSDTVAAPIEVTISNLTLTGGDAETGGAIFSYAGSNRLRIEDSVIADNAALLGGGIFANQADIIGTQFLRNFASGDGGALIGGGLTINGSSFRDNVAGNSGGALATTADIKESEFVGNIAMRGDGGAVIAYGSMAIESTLFKENNARRDGGAINHSSGSLQIIDSQFLQNSALGDVYYTEGRGGAIKTDANLSIQGSEIVGNSGHRGGGIYLDEILPANLDLQNSMVSGNTASAEAGGIYASCTAFNIVSSSFTNNKATTYGGGIAIFFTPTTISSTIFDHNSANLGGGIYAAGASRVAISHSQLTSNDAASVGGAILYGGTRAKLMIEQSTISDNRAKNAGGISAGGTVSIISSTISGNVATERGGGIVASSASGSFRVQYSTIAQNSATVSGGGIRLGSGTLSLEHSIVANNNSPQGADLFRDNGIVSATNSLIGYNDASTLNESTGNVPDVNGNLIGGPTHGTIDPLLGPLADNGGPTMTHALLAGSPAINAGDLSAVAGAGDVPQFDQRGEPFGRVFNGRIDIGAFEYQQPSDLNLLVDTLVDENDGNYVRGDLSLREAVLLANKWPSVDTIRFDPALNSSGAAKITLTQGVISIGGSLTIDGPGSKLLTIDASGNDPTPTLDDGRGTQVLSIGGAVDVTLSGLTITGGDSSQRGGAIFNKVAKSITLRDTVITGNATRAFGGGIYAGSTKLVIESSTISNNIATGQSGSEAGGGGVFVRSGGLAVRDSLITGNSALVGGGIYIGGYGRPPASDVSIERTTITGNQAFQNGGGIALRLSGGSLAIVQSEISDNLAGGLQPNLGKGGGIYAELTSVAAKITGSKILDNTASSGGGGYARLFNSDVIISNTQVHRNQAFGSNGSGGGFFFQAGRSVNIVSSTIDGNRSLSGTGGGIFATGTELTLENCTVSGNMALGGGGISQNSAPLHVRHSTITANRATTSGGGFSFNGSPSLIRSIENSIIAANFASFTTPSDILGFGNLDTFQVRYSLIGTNSNSTLVETMPGVPDAKGNFIGGSAHGPIDPLLGALADNGGPTPTHALLPGSLAANSGDPSLSQGIAGVPTHDQRGAPYIRVYGGRSDIGAFEAQPDALLGDYNVDGVVDTADYLVWRKAKGSTTDLHADGNGDGIVDDADYSVWRVNFGEARRPANVSSSVQAISIPAVVSLVRSPSVVAARPVLVAQDRVSSPLDLLLVLDTRLELSQKEVEVGTIFAPSSNPIALNDVVDSAFATLASGETDGSNLNIGWE